MIHILTVHWKDDKWIDIQLEYLNRNINKPFKVYTFLNNISEKHKKKYFFSSTENIHSHPIKLNLLADIAILCSINENDWLMFLDGDAFPVGDVVSFAERKLKEYPLLAIQRKENLGDIQPHPSFCITTIKFWKAIKGDWMSGYCWKDEFGRDVTDIGGNLFGKLVDKGINWYPILRSNLTNLHPVWFGVYENLIYHHGAGFRAPVSRIDVSRLNIIFKLYYLLLRKIPFRFQKSLDISNMLFRRNKQMSDEVFIRISNDPLFYQAFMSTNSSTRYGM